MGGLDIAAITGLFGLTSVFALIGTILAAWMAWRIVEKTGLPGWAGLGAVLLTLTGIGSVVPLILLWVFAFMRWPRDGVALAGVGPAPAPTSLAPPPKVLPSPLPSPKGWRLAGGGVTLAIDGSSSAWTLTGAPAEKPTDLSILDVSVGRPHARLFVAGDRLGLEDLGTAGGTMIDGARLLPEHGPRDISAARIIRIGNVDLGISKA